MVDLVKSCGCNNKIIIIIMKSRNYRKQTYWALHTHFGKYQYKNIIDSAKTNVISTMNSNNRIAATP